jgi:hypothetical protein
MRVIAVDVCAEWASFAAVDAAGRLVGGYQHRRPRNLTPSRWAVKVARRAERFADEHDAEMTAWAACRCGCRMTLDVPGAVAVDILPPRTRGEPLRGAMAIALAALQVAVGASSSGAARGPTAAAGAGASTSHSTGPGRTHKEVVGDESK